MKWQSRDRITKSKRSQKDMGRPFKRERSRDSISKKKLAHHKKKVRQAEQQAEVQEEFEEDTFLR